MRSEVIGSLLRPPYLAEARRRHEAGEISAAEFKRLEDRAVDEAIDIQTQAGIDVITDGEMRRYAFYGHLIDSVDGFDKYGGWGIEFRDEKGEKIRLRRPVVVKKLRWRRHMAAEDWTYLRARTPHRAKVTLISAQQAAAYYDPEKSRDAYPTRDAYLADIVDITRREIEELRRLGCTYVQIDAPQYAALLDHDLREGYRPRLETEQDLKRRIADAARIVPLERLALSPQCGFASTMEGNKLSQEDQRAKLDLVARVARSVFG